MRSRNASPSWMSHRVGWCAPSISDWPSWWRPCGCRLRACDLFQCRRHASGDHTKPQRVTAGSPGAKPRSGDRSLAWGVSPRNRTRKDPSAAKRRQTSGYGVGAGDFASRPRHRSELRGLRDPREDGSWRQCRKAPSQDSDVLILCGSVTLFNGGCSWGQSIKRISPSATSARSSSRLLLRRRVGTSCPKCARRSRSHSCQVRRIRRSWVQIVGIVWHG